MWQWRGTAWRSLALGCTLGAAGCGKPARIEPPALDPPAVGARAIKLYDQNADGQLSRQECDACPPLLAAFDRYDTAPGDDRLSADEIAGRLQAMIDSRVGQMPCYATVTLNGQLLGNATVRLVPDPMFDGALSDATGTSSYKGLVRLTRTDAPAGTPGVQFGMYRVEITHPQAKLPERYNSATTLGMEVSPLERDGDSATFALRSTSR
jgi:hypothetical protein